MNSIPSANDTIAKHSSRVRIRPNRAPVVGAGGMVGEDCDGKHQGGAAFLMVSVSQACDEGMNESLPATTH